MEELVQPKPDIDTLLPWNFKRLSYRLVDSEGDTLELTVLS